MKTRLKCRCLDRVFCGLMHRYISIRSESEFSWLYPAGGAETTHKVTRSGSGYSESDIQERCQTLSFCLKSMLYLVRRQFVKMFYGTE